MLQKQSSITMKYFLDPLKVMPMNILFHKIEIILYYRTLSYLHILFYQKILSYH